MKKAFLFLNALFALTACARMAQAAHPLVTEDTATQGSGNWQLEANADHLQYRDQANGSIAGLTLTYGALEQVDVLLTQALYYRPASAAGDVALGLKWRVLQGQDQHLGLRADLLLPTGNSEKGFGYGRANSALTGLWAGFSGNWTLLGNVALASNHFREDSERLRNRDWVWRASGAAVYRYGEQWRFALDAGVRRNPLAQQSRVPAYALAGVIYAPSEAIDLDLGAKFGLNRAEVQRQLGAGLTIRF